MEGPTFLGQAVSVYVRGEVRAHPCREPAAASAEPPPGGAAPTVPSLATRRRRRRFGSASTRPRRTASRTSAAVRTVDVRIATHDDSYGLPPLLLLLLAPMVCPRVAGGARTSMSVMG